MFSKNLLLKSGILASIGFVTTAVFLVLGGIDYRNKETAGLPPGYPPSWIPTGTYIGLIILGLGILCMAIVGVLHLVKSSKNRQP